MKRLYILVLSLIALSSSAFAGDTQGVLAKAMEGKAVPGMAALVIRDSKVAEQLQAGKRRVDRPDPVKAGDRWNLGSDGKAMTATMVARLVEKGKLRWDTPLAQLLPELAADMQPQYRDVTLLELMSHRAGLPENHDDLPYFYTFLNDKRPLPVQRLDYLRKAVADAPVGPARGDKSYSNTGLILAAAVAERATGKPFEQLMREEVFGPLGMKSPTFAQAAGTSEPIGHVDGRVADQPRDSNPAMFMPAGGVRMSLSDWAMFCIDQMNGDRGQGRLLKPATYKMLHTGQGATNSGLGWGVATAPMGLKGPALTHAGSDGNWYALVVLFLDSRNGVLVVANAAESMGGDKASGAAIKTLASTIAPPAPAS
ncbi:MAG: serine hydrolase domain-containing protein [Caulobacteraceae bacterium]